MNDMQGEIRSIRKPSFNKYGVLTEYSVLRSNSERINANLTEKTHSTNQVESKFRRH